MKIVIVVGWACLALAASVFLAAGFAPTVEGRIDPRAIDLERGRAFVSPMPFRVSRLYSVQGENIGVRRSGRMTLLEDGIALGPDQESHERIRSSGNGAYSHWGDTLYFSSSDGSDPRTNDRVYAYRVGAALRPKIERLGIVAALAGLFCLSLARRLRVPTAARGPAEDAARAWLIWRAGVALLVVGAVWLAALLLVPWAQGLRPLPIDLKGAKHAGGRAYYAALPGSGSWPWRAVPTLTSRLVPGLPQLLEDGARIGTPTAVVLDVARGGGGRFAYFDNVLALSASDDSDPRANGRRYVLETPTEPAPSAWLSGLAALIIGVALLLWRGGHPLMSAICYLGPRAQGRFDYALIGIAVISAVTMLIMNWWSGSTSHLGVASYLPVSDALGYYQCAISIGVLDTLNSPQFGAEWCSRRALYPAMLSSLLAVSGWRPSVALLLQAAAIGLGAGILLAVLRRSFGWITALFSLLGVAVIAREFALGNFMTESLGLVAGLAGVAMLFISVRRNEPSPTLLVLGAATLSLGMAVRAGALFALPALAVWVFFITSGMELRSRLRLLLLTAAALGFGLAFQFVVLHALGADPRNTGGNFAATLYGLSTGSRDWSQSYRDFPELFRISESLAFEKIQSVAVANIQTRPAVFLTALYEAGKAFVGNLFAFGWMRELNGVLTVLLCVGACVCIASIRKPAYSLLLALFAGELLSAPLIYDSGGHRVFIVTLVGRLALAALGIGWLIAEALRRAPALQASTGSEEPQYAFDRILRYAASGAAVVLVALALVPAIPLTGATRRDALPKSGVCKEPALEIVARLGRESMRLTFGEPALPLAHEALGIPPGRLELDPVARESWWLAQLKPQPRGTTLVYATQLAGDGHGKVVPTFVRAPLPEADGKLVSLCTVRETPSAVVLGDIEFLRIIHVEPRPDLLSTNLAPRMRKSSSGQSR